MSSASGNYDVVLPLRVRGADILIISVTDVDLPLRDRRVIRCLTEGERCELIGHRPVYSTCCGKMLGRKLTWNSYPVPMLAAMIVPALQQVGASDALHPEGPRRMTRKQLHDLALAPAPAASSAASRGQEDTGAQEELLTTPPSRGGSDHEDDGAKHKEFESPEKKQRSLPPEAEDGAAGPRRHSHP